LNSSLSPSGSVYNYDLGPAALKAGGWRLFIAATILKVLSELHCFGSSPKLLRQWLQFLLDWLQLLQQMF